VGTESLEMVFAPKLISVVPRMDGADLVVCIVVVTTKTKE
jgi:hypothetical protein